MTGRLAFVPSPALIGWTRGLASGPSWPGLTRPGVTGFPRAAVRGLWLLAILLILPAPSYAALMTARDLISACSGDARARATCDGYLMAVTDLVLQRESRGHGGGKLCVPDTVTQEQVRDAVMAVAQRPRAARAPTGAMLVMLAIRASWPCGGGPANRPPQGGDFRQP